MGELYQKMAQDLAIKNLAPQTREHYLRCCTEFARYHMRSPREMGLEEIKDYLGRLVIHGAGPENVKMHVAGLKFLLREHARPKGGRRQDPVAKRCRTASRTSSASRRRNGCWRRRCRPVTCLRCWP